MVVKIHCGKTGAVYELKEVGAQISIGRHPKQCQIVLPATEPGVSRVHASLRWLSKDEVLLKDTSSYGTVVDGISVTNGDATLKNGGTFVVGSFEFRVAFPAAESQTKQLRKRQPADVPTDTSSRSKAAATQRSSQRKMNDFFSSQSSQVLAAETPLSQMGASTQRTNGTSPIPDSQLSTKRNSLSISGPPQKKKKVSLFSQMSSTQSSITKEPLCMETTPSQLAMVGSFSGGCGGAGRSPKNNEIVADSQFPKVEEDAWKDVNSQMDFNPIAHSTQRLNTTCSNAAPPKAKKKKSIFQTPATPTEFKSPMLVDRKFNLQSLHDISTIPEASNSSTRSITRKRSVFTKTQAVQGNVEEPFFARPVEPKRSASSLSNENRSMNSSAQNFDYSCVSSGKKYDDGSDNEGKGKPVKEADIEKVVRSMTQLIKFVDLTRNVDPNRSVSFSSNTTAVSSANGASQKANFKRFKKASQGRFNTSIPCISSAIGGCDDLVDFRRIRH